MSTGGIVGGIVGAAVGFVVSGFNPVGAAYGFALGLAAGSLLDPPKGPTVAGPTIQDTAVQTSTYGVPIPRVYGTIGGAGNILWVENNKLKATIRKKKSSGGSKGGGGSSATTKTVTYSATFILGLCEGPIVGVRRIWCSDKLIYNAGSGDLETVVVSNQNATGFRIYLGTDTQMPDPRYEADVGVGNAPAFRGLACIGFYDFQLADFSNTLQAAQFKVEVMTAAGSAFVTIQTDVKLGTASSFRNPQPYYVTPELIKFYVPNWGTPFPEFGVLSVWKYIPGGGFFFDEDIEVVNSGFPSGSITFDPPSGSTNNSDEYFLGAANVFPGSVNLLGSGSGGFSKKGDRVVAASTGPVPDKIFYYDGETVINAALNGPAVVLLTDSGVIYAANSSSFFRFDTTLTQVATLAHSLGTATQGEELLLDTGSDLLFIKRTGEMTRLDYDLVGATSIGTLPAKVGATSFTVNGYISGSLLVRAYANTSTYNLRVEYFSLAQVSAENAPLAAIIEAEVDLSTLLTAADIDTSALTSTVRGYRVSGGALRAALEPLQGAFPFDIRESGYGLKCVPRGQASVMTIPETDLGATDADTPGDSILQSREMDSQLPARTVISYFDSAREYAISEQYAERLNTEAINRVDRDLPLVLTANEAAGVAEVLQFLPWLERTEAAIALPPTYLALEPADVVTVTTTAATYELRLTEINYAPDGRLECKARPNRAALYTSNALGGEGVAPDGTIGLAGPSDYELLDIPVVDEGLQNAPGLSVAMTGFTTAWPGGVLFRSADQGQTWSDIQAFPFKGTFGTTSAPMVARSGSLLDRGSSLVVSLLSGTLESITESAMLNGANFAAYGANGRWEIIRFANATLNGDGTYTLSVFWRGDRGTEQYTGTHVTGDTFVLLDDPDNAFIGYPTALIGSPQTYRAITSGASIDSDSDLAFTYAGVNLECYSGVHPKGVRDTSLNLTVSWKRRTRVGGEWRDSVDASLGETTESYEVDILNGSAVVRTVTSTTPSVSYTAAQQTTDFGSAQASVLVRIYQLSSVVGRGYPLEATL